MVGMRHRVVHDDMRINLELVFQVLTLDIPELIDQLGPLVPPED